MTALAEALRRLRERNQPDPQPPIFLAHPAWTEDDRMVGYLLGMQAAGYEVRVMGAVDKPAPLLDEWLARPKPEICGNCDTALPGGCGGLFADEAQCRWKP